MARTTSPIQWGLILLNVTIRTYCALYMIIADCDETFNYWEPLNLLLRGFGKQTWEYSPEYAIRSYAYLLPYYLLAYPLQFIFSDISVKQFYWLRLVAFCGFTSYTEIRLFRSIQHNLGSSKVANWFLFFTSIAPGMSHASVAFLPSSFAMNWSTLAIANLLEAINKKHTKNWISAVLAISQFLIGGIVGWPFALALSTPFGLYIVSHNIVQSPLTLFKIISGSLVGLLLIVSTITLIDSWFYNKWVLVPLNIVLYNVFGGEGEGPEIFGVEDFSYYILNLLLNFNLTFILGYLGSFLNPLIGSNKSRSSFFVISAPLLLWSFIFGNQPHKEERFLYPIYTLICLNAAIFIDFIFTFLTNILKGISKDKKGGILSSVISKLSLALIVSSIGVVSVLRILNLVENYSAPITVSERLFEELNKNGSLANVCIGREWYHYPNSFFLLSDSRLRFVKSGFDGLLPGDFLEFVGGDSHSISEITSSIPLDMNNKNEFSETKIIPFEKCDYYFDNTLPVDFEKGEQSIIEVGEDGKVIVNDSNWEIISCSKLISSDGISSGIGKILWIPYFLRPYIGYNVDYTQFCSLKRV